MTKQQETSLDRGIRALGAHRGSYVASLSGDGKHMLQFPDPSWAVQWRSIYARQYTTRFVPGPRGPVLRRLHVTAHQGQPVATCSLCAVYRGGVLLQVNEGDGSND